MSTSTYRPGASTTWSTTCFGHLPHSFEGGSPFTVAGGALAKSVAVVEAGVETQLRTNMTLGASYAGQFGNGLEDHGFKVNLNWLF
jgi:outer membrane autotransporter protein